MRKFITAVLAVSTTAFASAATNVDSLMLFKDCAESAGPGLGQEGAEACWKAQRRLVARGVEITDVSVQLEMQMNATYFDAACLSETVLPNGKLVDASPEQLEKCKID